MYDILTDDEVAVINKASELTATKYERNGYKFLVEDYKLIIENLIQVIEDKEKTIQDMENDIRENYRRISIAEQVCDERC